MIRWHSCREKKTGRVGEIVWAKLTYGEIAVLLPVLADFLFCDGHRFGRVGLWLRLLWGIAGAVCLRSDGGGKGVGHGRGRSAGSAGPPVADDEEGGNVQNKMTVRERVLIPAFTARQTFITTKDIFYHFQ
jgi:hypothetical protein